MDVTVDSGPTGELTVLGNGSELWGTDIWALYLDPGVGSELAKSRELR